MRPRTRFWPRAVIGPAPSAGGWSGLDLPCRQYITPTQPTRWTLPLEKRDLKTVLAASDLDWSDRIGNTRTETGLWVRAELNAGQYPTGVRVTKEEMDAIALVRDGFHGEWNYKLLPR